MYLPSELAVVSVYIASIHSKMSATDKPSLTPNRRLVAIATAESKHATK